ncbi:serine/threonine protein kinase [Oscillospiraceae bacterium 44-34]|jgi:selenophosphate synthase
MIQLDIGQLVAIMGIPSAITGFCFWMLQRRMTKRDEELDRREKAREKNEVLLVRSVGAAIALGEAAATALKNGHANGETEAALEYARQVKHEQKDFLTEQGIRSMY